MCVCVCVCVWVCLGLCVRVCRALSACSCMYREGNAFSMYSRVLCMCFKALLAARVSLRLAHMPSMRRLHGSGHPKRLHFSRAIHAAVPVIITRISYHVQKPCRRRCSICGMHAPTAQHAWLVACVTAAACRAPCSASQPEVPVACTA